MNAGTPAVGDARVPLTGNTVGSEMKEKHKVAFNEHVMGDLDSRISVMDARAAKQSLISYAKVVVFS